MKKCLLLLLLSTCIGAVSIADKTNAATLPHTRPAYAISSYTADSAHWSFRFNHWMCADPSYNQAYGNAWIYTNGNWYYVDENGYMLTSTWIDDNYDEYYVDEDGVMQTGWTKISTDWYYFWDNGTKSSNTIIDSYSLGPDGKWQG